MLKRKRKPLRYKKAKRNKQETSLEDLISVGDKVCLTTSGRKYLVKNIRSCALVLKCLELTRLYSTDIQTVYCQVDAKRNKIVAKYNMCDIEKLDDRTWREELRASNTILYMYKNHVYVSVIIERTNDMLRVQPFGTDVTMDFNLIDYVLPWSGIKN